MTLFSWILLGLVVGLIIYVGLVHRAVSQLTRAVEERLETQSRVIIKNQEGIAFIEPLVRAFNNVFAKAEETQVTYLQERQMLDQTIHNISHDIRTPLTVSWGYAKQLLKHDPTNETLAKIDSSLANVSKRLEYLLEYQNLLEKNIQPSFKLVNLSQLVSEQVLSFYDTYQRLNLEVSLDIQEGLQIKNDEEILERIVQNMLGNVAKHGCQNVLIELKEADNQVSLKVSNQTKQPILNLERLTQRFYAEDLSSSEKSSGLGLYITEQLVVLTKGRLTLDYQEGLFSIEAVWPQELN